MKTNSTKFVGWVEGQRAKHGHESHLKPLADFGGARCARPTLRAGASLIPNPHDHASHGARIPSCRRGVTLIELLVVITVILMMMGLAANRMQVAKDARRCRETARAISVYLGSARSTALANRRPCGVMLVPTTGIPACVMTLQQAEVPPPYAGDSTSATATVNGSGGTYQVNLSSSNGNLIHDGDVIQFNYEGPWLQIHGGGTSFSATLDMSQGQVPPPWTSSVQMPFRIYRQPYSFVTKSMAAPLQLPAGAVIDLSTPAGGTGSSGTDAASFSPGGNPIFIMFSPSGAIQSVYQQGNNSFQGAVSQPIFLLVGKPAKARGLDPNGQLNYQDLENLWVVINPQTGLVTAAPVAAGQSLSASRVMARTAQLQGGW